MTGSKRIDWIDLAKDFCILMIVITHTCLWVFKSVDYPMAFQMLAFMLPLFYALSGMFFRPDEAFMVFLKRKTNRLLIPFLFFFVVTSMLPCAVIKHESALTEFFKDRNIFYNNPIWFLLSLFDMNLMFYIVHHVAKRISIRYQTLIVMVAAIVSGIIGMGLSAYHVALPFYLDISLTSMPFLAFGYWLFRHTGFVSAPVHIWRDGALMIACGVIVWLFSVRTVWAINIFPDDASMLLVYVCGFAGTMMVLILSKFIRHLPLVSFWGRYSIIILCTHQVVITIVSHFLGRWFSDGWQVLAVLVATLAICHFLILFMRKFMPHVTAQKDVIRIDK